MLSVNLERSIILNLNQNERNILEELSHAYNDENIDAIRDLSSQYKKFSGKLKTLFLNQLISEPAEYDPMRDRWYKKNKLRIKAETGKLEIVKFIIKLGKQLYCNFVSEIIISIANV